MTQPGFSSNSLFLPTLPSLGQAEKQAAAASALWLPPQHVSCSWTKAPSTVWHRAGRGWHYGVWQGANILPSWESHGGDVPLPLVFLLAPFLFPLDALSLSSYYYLLPLFSSLFMVSLLSCPHACLPACFPFSLTLRSQPPLSHPLPGSCGQLCSAPAPCGQGPASCAPLE